MFESSKLFNSLCCLAHFEAFFGKDLRDTSITVFTKFLIDQEFVLSSIHSLQPRMRKRADYSLLDLYNLVSFFLVKRVANSNTLGFEVPRNKASIKRLIAVYDKPIFCSTSTSRHRTLS